MCMREGCEEVAAVIPVVSVWGSPQKDHAPAVLKYEGLETCRACVPKVTMAELVTDEGRAMFEGFLTQMGKPVPYWQGADLSWEPIR